MDNLRRNLRQISRLAQSYTAKALKDTDLSPSQIQALRVVTFHRNISQTALVRHLGIDKAAVARIITELERKSYILRLPDDNDKRVKRIYPTPAADAVRQELIAAEGDFFDALFTGVAPKDMLIFSAVLDSAYREALRLRDCGFNELLGEEVMP